MIRVGHISMVPEVSVISNIIYNYHHVKCLYLGKVMTMCSKVHVALHIFSTQYELSGTSVDLAQALLTSFYTDPLDWARQSSFHPFYACMQGPHKTWRFWRFHPAVSFWKYLKGKCYWSDDVTQLMTLLHIVNSCMFYCMLHLKLYLKYHRSRHLFSRVTQNKNDFNTAKNKVCPVTIYL